MVLSPADYDIRYFDGSLADYQHNAGFSRYERWHRYDGENSTGEFWRDWATEIYKRFNLRGKHVLEVGCAKGFVVEDLRSLGVDAWGVDVSEYAISHAPSSVQSFLRVADVRDLPEIFNKDEFDFTFSRGLLECFDDLAPVVESLNFISGHQAHFTHLKLNSKFYANRSLDDLLIHKWKSGTYLIAIEQNEERVK